MPETQSRGVLFDFDGTLYGDWRLWIELIREVLQAFQIEITGHQALEKARAMILDASFHNISGVAIAIAREEGVDKDQEIRTAFFQRLDQVMDTTGPADEVLSILDALKKENFRLALVTFVRQPRITRRLAMWKLTDFFSSIMTPERFAEFKPSPKPFLEAIRELDLSAAECVAVGDEPADMMGAKAAGVRAIGLPHGFFSAEELRRSGADVTIQSLSELPSVLGPVARRAG